MYRGRGAVERLWLKGRTLDDVHVEIDDAFIQGSYLYLEPHGEGRTYINPADVRKIRAFVTEHGPSTDGSIR